MLPTRLIPIYGDDPDDWQTFLDKAAKGSMKAADILNHANMAYMIAFTGNAESPETMRLDDFNALVRDRFPKTCPISSIFQFHDVALAHGWITAPIPVSLTPFNAASEYASLWGRSPVKESELMNDSMLNCLRSWSPEHYIECANHYGLDYDSRILTTAMLYMSVTWPGT